MHDARIAWSSACPDSPSGWHCPSYGERLPATSLEATVQHSVVTFVTLLGPPNAELNHRNDVVTVATQQGEACVRVATASTSTPPATQDRAPLIEKLFWKNESGKSERMQWKGPLSRAA